MCDGSNNVGSLFLGVRNTVDEKKLTVLPKLGLFVCLFVCLVNYLIVWLQPLAAYLRNSRVRGSNHPCPVSE